MPSVTELQEALVQPDPSEAESLERLNEQMGELERLHQRARLTGPEGEGVQIPDSAFHALRSVIQRMAQGQTITLIPYGRQLTTQEAADLLHVSRPHLIKVLEGTDELAYHFVGSHRRIKIEDVLAYRDRRNARRQENIRELTRQSQQLGAYEHG